VDLADRKKRYAAIEEYRKRPLVVYATSTRPGVPAQMAPDAVREFIDQIDAIADEKQIDILLHSTGGDALTAWKLISILRERFDTVSVLVPFMAFSAATIFSLGADEIIMHPHASLGPIDPQITIPQPDGKLRQFAYEDVGAFLRFLTNEVKVTEQVHVSAIIEKLFSVVDPVNVGAAKRASELSSSVGERLLLMHMSQGDEKSRAKQIAENLNKSFFAHGDAVSRKRAKELQLKIADPDVAIEKLMWQAYLGLESYMQLRQPFTALQEFLSIPEGAEAVRPVGPFQIPPNTPAAIAQQMWQAVMQQALQGLQNPGLQVDYSVVNALVEGTRFASEFRSVGKISAFRAASGEIQVSVVPTQSGWTPVPV
jgi:Serine dehydrogenase proteinase